ncbi:MAG: type II toxin-antitoxin system HicB family antitoxin [Nitrososphaerales archaeon]
MKTLDRKRDFHVVIERGEDGYYIASVVGLPGCHTQAKRLDQPDKRVKEVIELYLEEAGETAKIPEFIALEKVTI